MAIRRLYFSVQVLAGGPSLKWEKVVDAMIGAAQRMVESVLGFVICKSEEVKEVERKSKKGLIHVCHFYCSPATNGKKPIVFILPHCSLFEQSKLLLQFLIHSIRKELLSLAQLQFLFAFGIVGQGRQPF